MTEQLQSEGDFARLGDQIAGAEQIAAQFAQELARFRGELTRSKTEVNHLGRALDQGLKAVIGGLLQDHGSLTEQLRGSARKLVNREYRASIKPVTEALSSQLPADIAGPLRQHLPEFGPYMAPGRLAQGDGRSAAGAARAVQVVFNISTPDVAGFRQSQSQIAAQMGRLLAQGERNG